MTLDLKQGVSFTNLGRAFHPIYIYHRRVQWLMALAAVLTAISAYLRAESLLAVLGSSLNVALSAFLAWALARELAPDREALSLLAILWIIPIVIFIGPVALLPSAVFIGTARYLIRVIGLPFRSIEILALFLMPIALMVFYQEWVFGLLALLTFGLETYFEKFPRNETIYMFIAFVALTVFIIINGWGAFTALSPSIIAVTALITLLTLLKLVRIKPPQSQSDFNHQPISLPRLRAMVALSMLVAVLALHNGDSGFLLLAPLWAALFTAAL